MRFKKILLFLLILSLTPARTGSLYASEADAKNFNITREKATEIAIQFLNDNFDAAIDAKKWETDISMVDNYRNIGIKAWHITFHNTIANISTKYTASVNMENGDVLETDIDKLRLRKEQAKDKAYNFIKKVRPEIISQLRYADEEQFSSTDTYFIKYVRTINDISYNDDYICIGVDRISGKVSSCSFVWSDLNKAKIQPSDGILSISDAEKVFMNNAGIKLMYIKDSLEKDSSIFCKGMYYYDIDSLIDNMIDAKDGILITNDGTPLDKQKKRNITKKLRNEIFSTAKASPKLNRLLSEKDAKRIMEKEIQNLFGRGYKIDSIDYIPPRSKGYDIGGKGQNVWTALYVKQKDGLTMGCGTIEVDASTGKLSWLRAWPDIENKDEFKPKITWEAAYDKSVELIKTYYPEYIKRIDTEQVYNAYPEYIKGSLVPRFYRFCFFRVENGVKIKRNHITTEFDIKTGELTDIRLMWDSSIQLPKAEDIFENDAALSLLFRRYKPELQYVRMGKYTDSSKQQDELRLVYKLNFGFNVFGMNAVSGRLVDREGILH